MAENGLGLSVPRIAKSVGSPESSVETSTGVKLSRKHCQLIQQLSQKRPVLAVAATKQHLFAGVIDNDVNRGVIQVWSLYTFHMERELVGHTRGVSSLVVARGNNDEQLLLSAAADCTVRLWSADDFNCLCVLQPYLLVGNVFALSCTANMSHIFLACQNTSIQVKDLSTSRRTFQGSWNAKLLTETHQAKLQLIEAHDPITRPSTPYLLSSSLSSTGRSVFSEGILSAVPAAPTARRVEDAVMSNSKPSTNLNGNGHVSANSTTNSDVSLPVASVEQDMAFPMSHNGYVYCLTTTTLHLPDSDVDRVEVLISGSGDGTCKIWRLNNGALKQLYHLIPPSPTCVCAVLCLLVHEGFLFCGLQGGQVTIWDLDTFECTRKLEGCDDINAMVACQGYVFIGSADGTLRMIGRHFETIEMIGTRSNILSLTSVEDLLIIGGSGNVIEVWRVPPQSKNQLAINQEDAFLAALEQFVSLRSVSGEESLREECRRAAKFLKKLCQQLGAEAKLVPCTPGKNPVVVAKFAANSHVTEQSVVPTVLFYGHYDVQPADEKEWQSPAFTLSGRDGYVYGRGVTDNKGPVLAALFAVSELWREERLPANFILFVEGEEESGSDGISNALSSCQSWLAETGPVNCILIANTYWLAEEKPCLTYGLRGVIRASIEVSGLSEDLHSGVDGGVVSEPLMDLNRLLAVVVDSNGRINIPQFYDNVRAPSATELFQYEALDFNLQKYEMKDDQPDDEKLPVVNGHRDVHSTKPLNKTDVLCARWNQPTLSIHNIVVSGPGTNTVIPGKATATISMRIVPDQDVHLITHQFRTYFSQQFQKLGTRNRMKIDITEAADWWLGDKDGPFFAAAQRAIKKVWHVDALCIREGGTIPVTRLLEDFFQAPAVHLPLGQHSDGAHLANERIRLRNLQSGREVIQSFLTELVFAASSSPAPMNANATTPSQPLFTPLKRKRSHFKFEF